MAKYLKVAEKKDIAEGKMIGFSIAGSPVLLANVGGRYYAMDSICPHAHAPLEDGSLEGTTVKCPWHGSIFDLETGMCNSGPAVIDKKVYSVKVEEGAIYIDPGH